MMRPAPTTASAWASRRRPQERQQRGYVLLLTLVVILLAGLITAGLARQSLRLALEATAAQEELQDRWGRVSIERAVLPTEALHRRLRPKNSLSANVQLGTETLAIELTDESAKLNLNQLLREGGRAEVEQALRRFSPGELPRRLAPAESADKEAAAERIEAWGQVFDLSALEARQSAARVQRAGRQLTLWGDGRLNLDVADPDLVRAFSEGRIDPQSLRDLLEQRELHSHEDLEEALGRVSLEPEERQALLRLLTTRSTCFGLWMVSRRSIEFCVWDRSRSGRSRQIRYRW